MKHKLDDYEYTRKETGRIAFKCLSCKNIEVYMARTSDGKRCELCSGNLKPLGFVRKAKRLEVKHGTD